MSRLSFLKTLTHMHLYLKIANTNLIGILDVILTAIMLLITQNPCMVPLRSQIQQIHAKSGPANSGTTTPAH